MIKIRVIIPSTSISVNTIQDHLPSSGRQKEIYAFPLMGSNRHRMALSGYPKISLILYHKQQSSSILIQ